jgi:hypothetical protein
MGRGFWILYDLTPVRELSPAVVAAEAHLFSVPPSVRLHGFDFEEFPRPRESHEPQYPPAGANIHYFLGSEPTGAMRLEILDGSGHVIREFTSEAAGEALAPPPEPGMREWRLERVGAPRLPKTRGLHRFVWDLRYPGPWHANAERSGRRGPLVPAGTYQARLTLGTWTRTVSFDVRLDPRVVKEGVTAEDVAAQAKLALEVRDALSRARSMAARLDDALKPASAGSERARKLRAIRDALVTAGVRYSRPMLVDQLEYLYQNLGRADQRPGQDALARHQELSRALDALLKQLEGVGR